MEHNYMAAQVFRRDTPDIIAQSVLLRQSSNPQTSLNVFGLHTGWVPSSQAPMKLHKHSSADCQTNNFSEDAIPFMGKNA